MPEYSMELAAFFPNNNFSLIGVILALPLIGAFINGVWGARLGKPAVRLMALSSVGLSFIASLFAFCALHRASEAMGHGEHQGAARLSWLAWEWMHTNGGQFLQTVPVELKFSIDALSGVMMLVVTGVGFLIHLYATSYMANDPGFARFFAYLNLFVFSMLVLILGDNLPVLFIGWEGVGLCSYLLIGFWFDKTENASAGKKAFIANRIGDFGLLCAMFLLASSTGALDWAGIARGAVSLVNPSEGAQIHIWPIANAHYTGWLQFLQPTHPITITAATAVGLALLLGCTGKSAQLPLYVWLPDAMAGPTPVSALIHAATMVTAGVYLICRLSFVFVLSPAVMALVACIGIATALLAASIALVQNDIKKVLAYSTVSQLGFMFLGVGVGAFVAGFFHVFTHAFFKACLFLGAGSVIHAMHSRVHDDVASQDMRNMGGLRKYMPITFWTFVAATAAIIGFPFTSGFFSKDEILFKAFVNHSVSPYKTQLAARGVEVWEAPTWFGPMLYTLGVIAATMTAFYMVRALVLTFFGEFRGWSIGRASEAQHGRDLESAEKAGHVHGSEAHDDLTLPGDAPHESPWAITLPLVVLGAAALFAGVLNMAPFHFEPLGHWLDPVFEQALHGSVELRGGAEHAEALMWPLAGGGVAAFFVGTALAYWVYVMRNGEPAHRLATALPRVYRFLVDKWRVDEFYNATIIATTEALATMANAFDKWVVDGILAKLTALIVAGLGSFLRAFQNGVVNTYAAFMVVGGAALGWFMIVPHPEVVITAEGAAQMVEATTGPGYTYRWDADGDGLIDDEQFSDRSKVTVQVEPGVKKTIRLEVKNAFGITRSKEIQIAGPDAPAVQMGLANAAQ